MLVLDTEPRAYCISGFDPADSESVASARAMALELLGKNLDAAQLDYLRLRTLLGYANPDSELAASYRGLTNEAWARLSESEQRELLD